MRVRVCRASIDHHPTHIVGRRQELVVLPLLRVLHLVVPPPLYKWEWVGTIDVIEPQ